MTPYRFRTLASLALFLALSACSTTNSTTAMTDTPTPKGSGDLPLQGIDWRLVSAPGSGPAPASTGAGAATLRFEDGRFTMSGPCNRHFGEWSRNGDRLRLGGAGGGIGSTKMMCPPETMAREKALLDAMAQPLALEFEGPFLRLVAADGSAWRFDSRNVPPPGGRELVVHVAGQRVPCTGVAPMLCLQVRTQPGAPWQAHYGDIEGFDWQVGVEYVIRVRELPVANPPADGSSLRWVLQEILQRSPPG